jgi:hypothetical protein
MTDSRIEVVGADKACKVHGYTSTDGGRGWRTTSTPKDVWYLDTDTTAYDLRGPVPGGVITIDCRPVAVTTVSRGAGALVSCDGFNVVDQPRARSSTPMTYGVDAPAAAAAQPRRTPLILAQSDTCLASLRRVTSQGATRQVACLGKRGAPLGLAVAGSRRIYAQVGLTLRYSGDGGRTFADYPRDPAAG